MRSFSLENVARGTRSGLSEKVGGITKPHSDLRPRCCGGTDLTSMRYHGDSGDLLQKVFYAHASDEQWCKELCWRNSVWNEEVTDRTRWCKGFTWDERSFTCSFKWHSGEHGRVDDFVESGDVCASAQVRCYVAPVRSFTFTGSGFAADRAGMRCDKVGPESTLQTNATLEDGTSRGPSSRRRRRCHLYHRRSHWAAPSRNCFREDLTNRDYFL